jgi:hypothetical protein
MISFIAIVVYELSYSLDEIFRRVIIIQFDNIFHIPVISLNLPMGLWMQRFPVYWFDSFPFEEALNFFGYISASVV